MSKRSDKKNSKKRYIGLKIFLIIIVLIGIAVGIFIKRVYDLDGNWLAALLGHNKNTVENLDRIDILVLGESQGNTDTMLIFTYDPKVQSAGMLSIPRDTFTGDDEDDARAVHKINSIYINESPEDVLRAVNKITGLDVKYYAVVDTKVLIELVGIIGGIEFDVPIDMKYDDYTQDLHIDLRAGLQKLNGDQVEQLVRFRHNNNGSTYPYEYGMEDYGRMKTQRNVVKTIAKQTIKLKHVWKVGEIVDTLGKNITTNIDLGMIKHYIPYGMEINVDDIESEQLPGESRVLNGIWFFLYDKEETKTVVDKIFEREPVNDLDGTDELNTIDVN